MLRADFDSVNNCLFISIRDALYFPINQHPATTIMSTLALIPSMPEDLQQAVTRLSALSGQTAAAITEAALRDYLSWRGPQLLDLKQAIAAADRGEFASDEEVNAVFAKYGA
jgi:predicted transcriptional regulator